MHVLSSAPYSAAFLPMAFSSRYGIARISTTSRSQRPRRSASSGAANSYERLNIDNWRWAGTDRDALKREAANQASDDPDRTAGTRRSRQTADRPLPAAGYRHHRRRVRRPIRRDGARSGRRRHRDRSTQPSHLFQPLLYQVATAALSPADIAVPIRGIPSRQANTEVILRTPAQLPSTQPSN